MGKNSVEAVMIYIGVDNGADGGLVAVRNEGGKRTLLLSIVAPVIDVASGKQKKRIPNIPEMARALRVVQQAGQAVAVLEKAQVMPLEGSVSAFHYGRGFGAWEGILAALEIPYVVVTPPVWQKEMFKGTEGDDTKARAILVAGRLLPQLRLVLPRCRKPHTGLADAACMSLFAERLDW